MSKIDFNILEIIVPPQLSELPIKIIRGKGEKELIFHLKTKDEQTYISHSNETIEKYAFIPCNNAYKKIEFTDILWVAADGSYSEIHFKDETKIILSYPLAEIAKSLPTSNFIRIHRSYLINMKHVDRMCGNMLYIGKNNFTIGREYRQQVQQQIIFLGIRNRKKKQPTEVL